jgi:hypothetical protein
MAFVSRQIRVTVQLAKNTQTNQPNTFAGTNGSSITIEGARTVVRITNSGAPVNGGAQIQVYGLSPSLMNQLSTLGLVFNIVQRNTITIEAGDDQSGFSVVYSGTIYSAYGDYQAQPNVPFRFDCIGGGIDQVVAAAPASFPGSANAADIMAGFARQMNRTFQNNGVSVQLANAYYRGSILDQARQCARDARISWGLIPPNTLAIWPLGGNRDTQSVPVISPATGMIGYPAFTQQGIIVKTLFNPQISFGSLVKVESDVLTGIAGAQKNVNPNFTGFPTTWAVNKLDLALDSLVPRGEWSSTIFAYNPNYSKGIIPPASS